jgi:ABC-2 type transport system permease protein
VRLFLHELRTEQLLFWRNREAAFFTFFLPIIFFLVFGSIYGNDRISGIRGAAYLEAGMIGYGVASTAFAGLAITMVIRRESGVLKRIRATPLPPAIYLVAVLVSTFVTFLIEAAYFTKLTRDVMMRHHHIWSDAGSLGVVVLWGVIGAVAAMRVFRWQPRER